MNIKLLEKNRYMSSILRRFKTSLVLVYGVLIMVGIFAALFVSHNESFYDEPIGRIISVENSSYDEDQENGRIEVMTKQDIQCIIKNGQYKDNIVNVQNLSSFSSVEDLNLKVDDEVFLDIRSDDDGNIASSKITGFKRDKYIAYIAIIFVILILVVGRTVGAKSLLSFVINIAVTCIIIKLFVSSMDLNVLFFVGGILFIILSLFIVSGKNEKTISAAISTFTAMIITLVIGLVVIRVTNWKGVRFEFMEFLTHPPENIFFIELIIGTLGGVLDIAISITSAVNELVEKNPGSDIKMIINSGRKIGQDIMGTMSNTLVFAYLSGSIPSIVLVLRNGYPIWYTLQYNFSLEIMRGMVSCIGIVLSIPITLFVSVFMMKNKKIKEA